MTLKDSILKRINQNCCKVWTQTDFYDLGNRDGIDKTLQRLTQNHELRRIDRGLYDKPRINLLTGKIDVPNYHDIIDAVARRDQVRLFVSST